VLAFSESCCRSLGAHRSHRSCRGVVRISRLVLDRCGIAGQSDDRTGIDAWPRAVAVDVIYDDIGTEAAGRHDPDDCSTAVGAAVVGPTPDVAGAPPRGGGGPASAVSPPLGAGVVSPLDVSAASSATGTLSYANVYKDVSVTNGGAGGNGASGNGASTLASASSDGHWVAFQSDATNLVSGDTNGVTDVFVRDQQAGTTTRVSVGAGGVQANDASTFFQLSADGRYVVFESLATNLVSSDRNRVRDLFVYDRTTSTTTRVSVSATGGELNAASFFAGMSHNGRFVAFTTTATNVGTATNTQANIYIRDLQSNTTTGFFYQLDAQTPPNASAGIWRISDDGRYVLFGSQATNLVAGGAGSFCDGDGSQVAIFFRDTTTGVNTRLAHGAHANGVEMTADARYVSFGHDCQDSGPDAGLSRYDTTTWAYQEIPYAHELNNYTISVFSGQSADATRAALTVCFSTSTTCIGGPNESVLWDWTTNQWTVLRKPMADGEDIGLTGDGFHGYFTTLDRLDPVDTAFQDDVYTFAIPANPTGGALGTLENPCNCNDTEPQATFSQGDAGDPVNTANGSYAETFDDLVVPGRGLPLDWNRSYNSAAASTPGPLGNGWTFAYNTSLSINTGVITVNQENGSQVTFTLTNGAWTAPPRVVATLIQNGDGTYTFTRGAQTVFTFTASGRLTAERDLNGYTTTLAYDGTGRLTTITDPAGRTLTVGYNANNQIATVTDTASPPRVVQYAYDGSGNLTDVTDVAGGVTHFTYDTNHLLLTMLDPNQAGSPTPHPLTNHYDNSARVDSQTDPMGRVTTFDYTTNLGATLITDPNGHQRVDAYFNGQRVSTSTGYETGFPSTWRYSYDPATFGVLQTTEPNGQISHATYDTQGNLLTRTDPLSHTTTYTYDALNDVTTIKDPKNVTTTRSYDTAGNLQSESTPIGGQTQITTYHYDDATHPGDITSKTDPLTKTWSYSYDSAGDLISSSDPLSDTTQYCYDGVGRRTATISPLGTAASVTCATPAPAAHTTYLTTNAFGDALTATDPNGHQITRAYDANRNVKTLTDPDNNPTQYAYDLDNELATVTRPDTTTLGYGHDGDGNQISQQDGAHQTTTYAYADAAFPNKVTGVTDPLNRTTTYGYDALGNQTTKQDPGGNCGTTPKVACSTYAYDAASRLTGITYSDGTTPNVTNVTYDADGQRTAMTDGTGTSSCVWDDLHRLTSSTNGNGKTVGYGYNLRGDLTSIIYPGSTGTVTRGYDDAGRLHTVTDWSTHQTTFNYDADSFMTSEAYPNGTTATYTPDGADQLTGITDKKGASTFASFNYGRDNANQLTSVASTGVPSDNHSYSYTQLNQLKTVDTTNYGYDPADNPTNLAGTTQTFDTANELTAIGTPNITLVGTASGGDTSSTSLQVNLPGGTTTNDTILVTATLQNSKTVNTPSGYTLVGTYTSGSTNTSAKVVLFRKKATSSDTNVTVTFGNNTPKAVTVAVYRGVQPDNPIDLVGTPGTATPGTSVVAPSISTNNASEQLVMLQGATTASAAGTWTAPTGMSEQVQHNGGTTIQGGIADQALTNSGATGTRTATYSQSAQLVGVLIALRPAIATYTYDTRGNRTSVTPATGSSVTLAYDQANRLKTYGTSTYGYNGDDLRMSKTVSGATTQQTWDAAEGLPLLIVDGTTNYVTGPGGLPLEQINGSTTLYYHQDQLGSTRALTDSNGNAAATYTYDSYGKLSASTGSATNPFGYAGQYTDSETGNAYLRARYYDPTTAQFLSRDPLDHLTRSAYAYGRSNPLNATDPSGLCASNDGGHAVLLSSRSFNTHCGPGESVVGTATVIGLPGGELGYRARDYSVGAGSIRALTQWGDWAYVNVVGGFHELYFESFAVDRHQVIDRIGFNVPGDVIWIGARWSCIPSGSLPGGGPFA
jgi:RHS repeat-associated protein